MGWRQPGGVYFFFFFFFFVFFFFSFLLFSYWRMIFAFGGNKGGKRVKKMGGEGRRKWGRTRRGGP
jgi:hypothetical protein